LQKRTKKLLPALRDAWNLGDGRRPNSTHRAAHLKVFWFFSSEKNGFLD
jgi:hypothetical protein